MEPLASFNPEPLFPDEGHVQGYKITPAAPCSQYQQELQKEVCDLKLQVQSLQQALQGEQQLRQTLLDIVKSLAQKS